MAIPLGLRICATIFSHELSPMGMAVTRTEFVVECADALIVMQLLTFN